MTTFYTFNNTVNYHDVVRCDTYTSLYYKVKKISCLYCINYALSNTKKTGHYVSRKRYFTHVLNQVYYLWAKAT